MSNLNCKAPKLQELHQPKQEEASSSPTRTIEDLPPEVLTQILEFVTLDAADQIALLGYRLVNLRWKDIVNSLIEKRIVSGEFPNSPVMIIEGVKDELQVCLPQTGFSGGRNPLPFNSLHFNRAPVSNNAWERSNYPLLGLEAFASRFGGTLTSLGVRDLSRFSISSMATMLSSMPNLKRLRLEDVTSEDENSLFPTPPPLSCLSTLELVSRTSSDRINNHYIWLFVSYADQLVRLHLLESEAHYPPLQAGHQYTYSDANGATRAIATSSESAFRNLKELQITDPSPNFLLFSETPALQNFSVGFLDGSPTRSYLSLEGVMVFIDRCSSTLQTLILSYPWNPLGSWEVCRKFVEGHRPLFLPTTQIVVPRLKTLAVYFPTTDINETVLRECLVKFPALEKLQLLVFQLNWFDVDFGIQIGDLDQDQIVNNEAVEVGNDNIQLADETVALKERLPPLFEYMSGIWKIKFVVENAFNTLVIHPYDVAAVAQRQQLEAEIERLEQAFTAARMERAAIFRRLVALGVNMEEVMVEQLLERGGYWNTCPRLQIVSVSEGKKPVGDVCVIRRTDDA